MFKLDLEKAQEPEIKLPTAVGSSKQQESSRKTIPKPLTVWITTNCGIFLKRCEYQITWPASWEICMQVKKQQLELDMEQQTGSKSGKEYIKAVYCHPADLTYMQSTSWEILGWMKHKLEKRMLGEISIAQICRWHHTYGLNKFWELVLDRKAWHAAVHWVAISQTWLSNWTNLIK